MDEVAWDAIRPNLETVSDAADWWRIVTGPIDAPVPAEEDRDFLALAHDILTETAFDGAVWRTLTEALKAETGRKGKALFLLLRRALTGMDHGPDLGQMLPLIGRDEAVSRLKCPSANPPYAQTGDRRGQR